MMGSRLALLMIVLATVNYSASSYNTTQTRNGTSTSIPGSDEKTSLEYECTARMFRQVRGPLASDCTLAIERLPKESNDALFHIGGDWSIYQLPWRVTMFGCKLTVDIDAFFLADFYNWLGVIEAATNLNYVCRSYAYPFHTGGWTMTGNLGRINVSLVQSVTPWMLQSLGTNSSIAVADLE